MVDHCPHVLVSYAQSIDGRIATRSGESRWISGDATLALAQQLRNDNQAILVGVGTVIVDDPLLTCRLPGGRSPIRVILDRRLRIPPQSQVVGTARAVPTWVIYDADAARSYHTDGVGDAARSRLVDAGVQLLPLPAGNDGEAIAIPTILRTLADRGVESLFVEGGATVITAFAAADAIDELVVVVAPMVIGEGIAAVGNIGVTALSDVRRYHLEDVRQYGQDVALRLRRRATRPAVVAGK